MMMLALIPGATFIAPPSMCPRGVFDVLGNVEAHIEINTNLPRRCYEVRKVFPGGPAPALGIYLGHVTDSYGTDVQHFYAVEVGHAG